MPALTPTIIKVTERSQLDTRGNLAKVIAILYNVGNHGPFTLLTTPDDIKSGKAAQDMASFAATLTTLPGAMS